MKLITPLISLFLTLFVLAQLHGHNQPTALTTISYNKNTNSTEIVHRLHAHDAARVLERLPEKDKITIDSLEGRARLALYVGERFELADKNGERLEGVSVIGAALEGDILYAYQEYEKVLPHHIRVRNDILRDILPDQVNTVNISNGEHIRTLVFSNKDQWKALPE